MVRMSSARDEQPDTVPPPAGEEDAYSAATKVGSMPAELMAKLRAEGLLPDDDAAEPPRPPAPRPATGLVPRPSPPAHAHGAFDDVPELSSDPPPAGGSSPSIPVTAHVSTPPPAGPSAHAQPAPSGVSAAAASASAAVETPVAFASPPSPGPMDVAGAPSSLRVAEPESTSRPVAGRSKTQTIAVLVAIVMALLAFAFGMALLSQRR